ncbi:hypothetical protein ACQ858_18130 [Variovorax ureilyticus]|uniref:hypothetical protein n=1 Tax=Variovorax ureilyticus TaxID=1836198 RepID=UPI003D66FBF4
MRKFKTNMFAALRAADRVIVDGLHVQTFQLEGAEGGSGVLNLEDGTAISFANQEIAIIEGYGAFHTEAPQPHSIDFIMLESRCLEPAVKGADIVEKAKRWTDEMPLASRLQPIG